MRFHWCTFRFISLHFTFFIFSQIICILPQLLTVGSLSIGSFCQCFTFIIYHINLTEKKEAEKCIWHNKYLMRTSHTHTHNENGNGHIFSHCFLFPEQDRGGDGPANNTVNMSEAIVTCGWPTVSFILIMLIKCHLNLFMISFMTKCMQMWVNQRYEVQHFDLMGLIRILLYFMKRLEFLLIQMVQCMVKNAFAKRYIFICAPGISVAPTWLLYKLLPGKHFKGKFWEVFG